MRGAVDVRALECAFAEIVGRHEILRTVYIEDNGELSQRVTAPGHFEINRTSSDGDPSPLMQRELDSAALVAPFDHRLYDYGYAIQTYPGDFLSQNAQALREWLIDQG